MSNNSNHHNKFASGRYNSLKGGPAPEHLKIMFINLLYEMIERFGSEESYQDLLISNRRIREITGILWNCTDSVPSEESRLISNHRGGRRIHPNDVYGLNFAQASRIIRDHINNMEKNFYIREKLTPLV